MKSILIKTFQELTVEELYSILKLRTDVFVVEQNCPYPELDGEDENAVHFFNKEKGKMAAYLRVLPPKSGVVRIGRVVTQKQFRGQNLSTNLMNEAMLYIKEHFSGKPIILSSQEHLQEFYAKFGFKSVSVVYLEDGIPHVDMELRAV